MSSPRRIAVVGRAEEGPGDDPDTVRLVIDPAWVAQPDNASVILGARQLLAPVLDRTDLFEESFQALDGWADALDLPGRLTVDGVSWWFRLRFRVWLRLVERAHWYAVLNEGIARAGAANELEVATDIPDLREMAAAFADSRGMRATLRPAAGSREPDGPTQPTVGVRATGTVRGAADRFLGYPGRRARRRTLADRDAMLASRVASIRQGAGGRVLVLTNPRVHQVVDHASSQQRVDPFLGSVVDRLRGTDLDPIVLTLATNRRDDDRWSTIETDPSALPDGLLAIEWADADDDRMAAAAGATTRAALADLGSVPAVVHGFDFGPMLLGEVRAAAETGVPSLVRAVRRAARMLQDLRIGAVVLVNEYGNAEWVAAGRSAGIPVVAVQHGVIVREHAGYRHPRRPGLILPTRTAVFGSFERSVLLEHGGYRPEEVAVTGAPRLDTGVPGLASGPGGPDHVDNDARQAIRRRLGVRPGDRLVVLSSTHEAVHHRFYWPHVMARLFNEPLPDMHLVIKLHPAEAEDGMYRELIEGLARAGGFASPPVDLVRDIDLLSLLAAADAHLGLYSTVLTDAVAVGTPNLIAATQARVDLLGYVAAGVARPVHDAGELREALAALQPPDEEHRRSFLEAHFRAGDATGRIVALIREAVAATATPAPDLANGEPSMRHDATSVIDPASAR